MKSSKEYYSEIYYSGVDRYFECKVRAQEYYIKKNNEKSSKRCRTGYLSIQLYLL